MEAVLAYIEGDDADLLNLLDGSAKDDALATAYRLTYLAAGAVQELARLTVPVEYQSREGPSVRLADRTQKTP